jgi:sugar lactone lactonase YvrE
MGTGLRLLASLALIALAAGCGGGGTAPSVQPAGGSSQGAGTMSIHVNVPTASTSSSLRRSAAITPATNGILIQSYAHTDTGHANPTGGGAYDISSTSSLCTTGTPRTCSIVTGIAAGNSDVVATTYDAAPVAGSFGAAHELGRGTIYNVAVVANANNALKLAVGGTIASVVVSPASQVVARTTPGNYNLTFTAYDAQSEVIVAGTTSVINGTGNIDIDTFANPLVFTVSESGGSGHTSLSVNGGAHAASVTSAESSDLITVFYDGAGAAGYVATISAAASGASPASVTMSLTTGSQMIYVANRDTAVVSWFALGGPYGNVAPVNTVGGSTSGMSDPVGLAVDSTGNIYTANDSGSQVFVFAPGTTGNVAATRTFTPTVAIQTEGLFVDGSGNEYESSEGSASIAVMPPNASGSVVPSRVISGSSTTLVGPQGMALDGAGNLYVTDRGASAIDVFAPGANGNIAPIRSISGWNTLLQHPSAVAIDASGRIIVADGASCCSGGFVLVFANGANGNVAPVARLVGAATGLLTPSGVAIDPGGGYWISDASANTVSKFAPAANGNVAPLVTIGGSATGLGDAQQLTIH